MGKTHEEVFQEAVPRLFGFLVSEFGFSLTQEGDWRFQADSTHSSMGIFLDKGGQVVVTFRPIDETDWRLPESMKHLRGKGGPQLESSRSAWIPTRMLNSKGKRSLKRSRVNWSSMWDCFDATALRSSGGIFRTGPKLRRALKNGTRDSPRG